MKCKNQKINEHHYVTDGAKNLIWQVFFQSKQRGINLSTHFPWLEEPEQKITCLTIEEESNQVIRTIATLVIRKKCISDIGNIGLVGMVCVDPDFRGYGLSTHLIQGAKDYSISAGIFGLILWTSHPKVYEKVDFFIDGQDLFGTIENKSTLTGLTLLDIELSNISVSHANNIGVPAFAVEVIEYSSNQATITICKTNIGVTLVKWVGATNAVLALIHRVLPKIWQLNVCQNDPLIKALHIHGYSLDLKPGAVRMALSTSSNMIMKIPYINILERI
jgi:GNAT superfamily N-acetyltransferase